MKTATGKKRPSRATSAPDPTHEEIAARAYELFLERGMQHGHDQEDWTRAEAEIRGKRQATPAPPGMWSRGYR